MGEKKNFKWNIVGKSVRGSSHKKKKIPNQDSLKVKQGLAWSIVAISDGHGSKKNFRSEKGSKLATDLLVQELEDFMLKVSDDMSLSLIKEELEEKLPSILIRKWNQVVSEHLKKEPFRPEEEFDGLSQRDVDMIMKRPEISYGATLVGILVSERFIVYLQLGDGDIMVTSSEGEVSKPISKDSRFIANETSSLCTEKAWNEVNLKFQAIVDSPPDLILACTDGYTNSFVTEDAFFRAGQDFLEIIHEYGLKYVQENLESWLTENSIKGSGDDITVAVISRVEEKE